jgi:amidase
MRPTEGRVSTDGMMPPGHPGTLSHVLTAGPMARSVADLRLAHALLTGAHGNEPTGAPTAPDPVAFDELRVAVSTSVGNAPVARDIEQSVYSFASTLREEGCTVEDTHPPIDFEEAQQVWGTVHGFEFAAGLPLGLGRPPLNKLFRLGLARLVFGPGGFSEALTRGYSASTTTYLQALGDRRRLLRNIQQFLSSWDVWICPVAGLPAFPQCRTGADLTVDGQTVHYGAPLGVFNTGMALAGTPCVVLPIGTTSNGLPIGVQIHARRHADERLLAIADTLERVRGGVVQPVSTNGESR